MPARRSGEKPAHAVIIEAIVTQVGPGRRFTPRDLDVPSEYGGKTVQSTLAAAALHGPGRRWDDRWQYVKKIDNGVYKYVDPDAEAASWTVPSETHVYVDPRSTTEPVESYVHLGKIDEQTYQALREAKVRYAGRRPASIDVSQAQHACHGVAADMEAAVSALQQSAEIAESEIAALYAQVARAHWQAARVRLDILLRVALRAAE